VPSKRPPSRRRRADDIPGRVAAPATLPAAVACRPPSPLPPRLLTVDAVAEHLGSSTRHVRRLIERGLLPVHRLGRLVRVSPDDLARLLAASRES
jgi:excisionase family DNA binding protein